MLKDYFVFAWVNLTHKKVRSWLTLIGIFIGVTAVVALIGLGDGLKLAITSQFGISSTEVITVQAGGLSGVGPPGTGVVNPLTQDDVDDIEKLSAVDFAVPRILESGKLVFNDISVFGIAMNVPDGKQRKFVYDVIEFESEQGRLLRDGDNKKILLGYNFGADAVGLGKSVKPGDVVEIFEEKFEVVGIAKKKGSFIFDNIVVINTEPLKELMDDPDRVDLIAVKVKNKDLMDKAAEQIEILLRKNRDVDIGEEDFTVQTPDAALSTVNDVLTGVQIFISMVAAISILIGAIGIINTMTTTVIERRSQIGIMKAIGAKNKDIFYQFLVESGMMGLMGGLIGAILGQLIAFVGTVGINAWIGSDVTPQINFILIGFTLLGTFIIGAIAGIIPAIQAAHEQPVEALRG